MGAHTVPQGIGEDFPQEGLGGMLFAHDAGTLISRSKGYGRIIITTFLVPRNEGADARGAVRTVPDVAVEFRRGGE